MFPPLVSQFHQQSRSLNARGLLVHAEASNWSRAHPFLFLSVWSAFNPAPLTESFAMCLPCVPCSLCLCCFLVLCLGSALFQAWRSKCIPSSDRIWSPSPPLDTAAALLLYWKPQRSSPNIYPGAPDSSQAQKCSPIAHFPLLKWRNRAWDPGSTLSTTKEGKEKFTKHFMLFPVCGGYEQLSTQNCSASCVKHGEPSLCFSS